MFGEEAHSHYIPYTPAAEAELKSSGASVRIVEISYRLSVEVYYFLSCGFVDPFFCR
jgi:hypothetical protein